MLLRPDPLPQDAAQLTRIILSLDAENADLKARVAFLDGQALGPKSEKMTTIDPMQTASSWTSHGRESRPTMPSLRPSTVASERNA